MSKPDDKKLTVDHDKDTQEIKIPSRRAGKKTSLLDKLNASLGELPEAISWRYVRNVAGAVLLCVVAVGIALIFADPSVVQIQKPVVPTEVADVSDIEHPINIKIREGSSTSEIAEKLAEKGVIGSKWKFIILA